MFWTWLKKNRIVKFRVRILIEVVEIEVKLHPTKKSEGRLRLTWVQLITIYAIINVRFKIKLWIPKKSPS